MFCENCGNRIDDSDNFCTRCRQTMRKKSKYRFKKRLPVFYKIIHYVTRIVLAIIVWIISATILLFIPSFVKIVDEINAIYSLIFLFVPPVLSVGVFLLSKKPLNKSKYFYNPDYFIFLTKAYSTSFSENYNSAIKAVSINDFLYYWNYAQMAHERLENIADKIHANCLTRLQWQRDRIQEFQWKLRDAIERTKSRVIFELNNEHRNNKQNRFAYFKNDLNRGQPYFSKETADFAVSAISSVAARAGISTIPADVDIGTSNNCNQNDGVSMQDIDIMDGSQFELWCKDFLSAIGYKDVSLTGKSGDQGVDLLALKDGIKYAIQCKCYSSDLGNTPVQEVNTGKVIYNCHVGAVLTNRRFTAGGKEAAKATGVLLWDRDWIHKKISSLSDSGVDRTETSPVHSQSEDNLYREAVNAILEEGFASVSFLQHKFDIGYAQAARLIDEMEENGVVGPFRGSTPREILISEHK